MSEWPMCRLAEVTTRIGSGATPRGGKEVYQERGVSFIRSQNVYDGRFSFDGLAHISDVAAHDLRSVTVEPNDVLINITGESVTRTALVPAEVLPARVSQHVAIVRPGAELDAGFLLAALLDPPTKARLNAISAAGATRRALTKEHLESTLIPVPSLAEQRRIAGVLGALDDLIETNRQQMTRLREVAGAYFGSASQDGHQAFFGEVAELTREGVSAHALTPGTPYLGLEHFGTDGAGITDSGDAGSVGSNKSRFRAGDVLYGKLRPYFRKHGRPGFDGVCSTEIWVLRGMEPYGTATVAAVVARPEFTDFAMQGSGGTRMPRADWEHVATMPVVVPPRERLPELERYLNELWKAGVDLHDEIGELTRGRDELLPLLVSGKVRARDVA